MTGEAPQGAQAVLRAIALLKAFTPGRPELSVNALSQHAGLTRATTHRLLSALESESLLARNPANGHYRLGPAIVAMGCQALLSSDLRVAVRPALEQLGQASGETATLEVLTGDQVLILDGVAGKHMVSASLDLGTHWPAHLCATGKAILALLPREQRDRVLGSRLVGRTPASITQRDLLERDLELTRTRGFAVAHEELEPDYVGVAAAFRDVLGQVEGAVCVGGPKSRFGEARLEQLGALVREAAAKLSQRHGANSV